MITWIILKTGLSATAVKLILIAAALAGIGLALRWYGNRQYYQGEKDGRIYATKEIEKAKIAEWAAKEASIAEQADGLATAESEIRTQAEQLAQDRANLSRTLADARAQLQRERLTGYATAAGVSDSRIWDDIRATSRELATDAR